MTRNTGTPPSQLLEWDLRRAPSNEPAYIAEQWVERFTPNHLPWSVAVNLAPSGRQSGRHQCSFEAIDDITLVRCTCDPCSGVRNSKHVSDTDGAFIGVIVALKGLQHVEQADTVVALTRGDIAIWDSSLPGRFRIDERVTKISLRLPQSAARALGLTRRGGPIKLDAASPATRLASQFVSNLAQTAAQLDGPSRANISNATVELIGAAVRAKLPPISPDVRAVLYVRMTQYIADHVAQEEITPSSLAVRHGISERTVQRVFASADDSVSAALRSQRLRRAREDVTRTSHSLAGIAHRWGYSDLSHFTRTFKSVYGFPPSQLRAGTPPTEER